MRSFQTDTADGKVRKFLSIPYLELLVRLNHHHLTFKNNFRTKMFIFFNEKQKARTRFPSSLAFVVLKFQECQQEL